MQQFDLIVVGELNADLILSGDVTPVFGQTEKLVDDASLVMGSSSAIFACGAARLGLRVAFVGKVGDDALGQFLLAELAKYQIDTSAVVVDPQLKTGLSVHLSRNGDRAILTYSGTIAELRYEEIDLSLLQKARHLHLGGYYLLEKLRPSIPQLFAQAKAQGLTTSLDTNYDPSEQWQAGIAETLQHVDIFLPNETELLAISQQQNLDEGISVLGQQVPLLVVKCGSQGARAIQQGQSYHAAAMPIEAIDTTGAGDSFDAGFIYAYLAQWPIEKSLCMACVCGALSTRGVGGTSAQATADEASALL
jgi:sugar/nucleoside kinase (ribokinase family)